VIIEVDRLLTIKLIEGEKMYLIQHITKLRKSSDIFFGPCTTSTMQVGIFNNNYIKIHRNVIAVFFSTCARVGRDLTLKGSTEVAAYVQINEIPVRVHYV
jgi:hypothetical protein